MLAGDGKTNVNFLWTSLDGAVEAQSLPSPVVGVCRNVVDQIVLGGAPHTAAFRVDYGGCVYHCRVRDDVLGGYKIIIVSECGCVDRRSFLMLYEGGSPSVYYASRPTGLVELIDPTEGTPRPDPDPATFTKGFKVPKELRVPPEDVVAARAPGGYTRVSSMYSGQMRKIAGCYHLSGLDAPFGYTYAKTHGVVEFPVPRAANAGGKYPPGKKFWLVELSPLGAFAMPFQYRQKCCDLPKQFTRAMPTDAEIAATPSLEQFKTELDLAWAFVNKPNAGVVQLISAAAMAAVYAKGSPQALSHGWAFSYSGNEASNVVFTPHNSPDNYWEIWHPRVSFTTANPSEGVFTITAAADYLTSGMTMHNNVNTLMWFQSEAHPGNYEQFFPYSFNGGTTVSVDYTDAPVYVFYQGDVRQTLQMSSATSPMTGTYGAYTDPAHGACRDAGTQWIAAGVTEKFLNDTAIIQSSMSVGGNTVSGVSGSRRSLGYTAEDGALDYFLAQGNPLNTAPFNCPCAGVPAWEQDWREFWTYLTGNFSTDLVYGGVCAAVLSLGDRESVFLLERTATSGDYIGNTRPGQFTMVANWRACHSIDPGTSDMDQVQDITAMPGYLCQDDAGGLNQHGQDCVAQASPTAPQTDTSHTVNDNSEIGVAVVGSNEFSLASNADISKFFTAKNPAVLTPIYSPGPVGWHGNLFYNEPSLVHEDVTIPTADYVLHDGTNGWVSSGGFSFIKPPSGPAIEPRAFVGRV
jgi:hypothetical protein